MTEPRKKVYQLKITLTGVRPPIWRRLLIASSTPLNQVHQAIQIAMGWTGSHLHQFDVNGDYFGIPDPNFGFDEMLDERRYKLSQFLKSEKDWIHYDYDFGDGWHHKIALEKVLFVPADTPLPQCLKGKRACPPEDIGGVWGYAQLLEVLADPAHPERENYEEMVAEGFDPDAFDLDETNAQLFAYCR